MMTHEEWCAAQNPQIDYVGLHVRQSVWEAAFNLLDHKDMCSRLADEYPGCIVSIKTGGEPFGVEPYDKHNYYYLSLKCPSYDEAKNLRKGKIWATETIREILIEKYDDSVLADLNSQECTYLINADVLTRDKIELLSNAGIESFLQHDLGL